MKVSSSCAYHGGFPGSQACLFRTSGGVRHCSRVKRMLALRAEPQRLCNKVRPQHPYTHAGVGVDQVVKKFFSPPSLVEA